jgi:hypothetical protein
MPIPAGGHPFRYEFALPVGVVRAYDATLRGHCGNGYRDECRAGAYGWHEFSSDIRVGAQDRLVEALYSNGVAYPVTQQQIIRLRR